MERGRHSLIKLLSDEPFQATSCEELTNYQLIALVQNIMKEKCREYLENGSNASVIEIIVKELLSLSRNWEMSDHFKMVNPIMKL